VGQQLTDDQDDGGIGQAEQNAQQPVDRPTASSSQPTGGEGGG
jgi:hypothetical protein